MVGAIYLSGLNISISISISIIYFLKIDEIIQLM